MMRERILSSSRPGKETERAQRSTSNAEIGEIRSRSSHFRSVARLADPSLYQNSESQEPRVHHMRAFQSRANDAWLAVVVEEFRL